MTRKIQALMAIVGLSAIFLPGITAAQSLPVQLQKSSEVSANIVYGSINTLFATFANPGPTARVVLDLELKNSSGTLVAQAAKLNVVLRHNQRLTLSLQSPGDLVPDAYSFSAGIFTPNWKKLISWHPDIQTFSVDSGIANSFIDGNGVLAVPIPPQF